MAGVFDWLSTVPSLLFGQAEPAGTRSTTGYSPGIDLPLNVDTPIGNILGGRVVTADYGYDAFGHTWGGQVDIAGTLGGRPVVEEFLHLDQVLVSVGQSVGVGQLVGLSGGQLAGGSHPADRNYSTGPHIKYSLFQGNSAAAENPANAIDPGGFLASMAAAATGGTLPSGPVGFSFPNPFAPITDTARAALTLANDASAVIRFFMSGDFVKIGLGVGFLWIAFMIFIQPEAKQAALLGLDVASAGA